MTESQFMHEHKMDFFNYLHDKFPVFHLSNIFYRDIRYAMKYYMLSKGFRLSDMELEQVTDAFILEMTDDKILKPVSPGAWSVEYPDFRTKKPGKPVHQ